VDCSKSLHFAAESIYISKLMMLVQQRQRLVGP
jgi:hypothetical protein